MRHCLKAEATGWDYNRCMVVQDGAAAGQTIPHVHIHCVPRHFKDLEHNDEIYDRIDDAEAQELSLRQRYASTQYQHSVPHAVRFGSAGMELSTACAASQVLRVAQVVLAPCQGVTGGSRLL